MFADLNYKYTCKGVEKSRILNREDRSTEVQGRKGMPGGNNKGDEGWDKQNREG